MEQTQPLSPRRPLRLQDRRLGARVSPLEGAVLAVLLAGAALAGYLVYANVTDLNAAPAVDATTYIPAFRTDLETTIATTGTVQAEQEVTLNFGSSGEIAALNVAVGDEVTAGQELARLDDTQLQSALRSAQTNLASAQARLDALLNPSAADIASAQQSVLSAENQLAIAQQNLDDLRAVPTASDIARAQQDVLAAQNTLQNATDALANAQKAVADAQTELSAAQVDLDAAWSNLARAHDELEDAEDDCSDAPNTPGLPSKGSEASDAPYVSASFDCDSDAGGAAVYQAAVANYGSRAAAYNTSVRSLQTAATALASADAALTSGNLVRSIQSAQLGLQTAQQEQLDTLAGATAAELAAAENNVASAQASVTVAQERLYELLNPAADEVLPLQASVDSAADNVTLAEENLADAVIVAPFDGTVTAVSGSVGGQASATTSVITLVNPSLLRIDANVDQTDISSLSVGQTATVSFDALPDFTYIATVSTVGLAPTTSSGVVTYVVSFSLDTAALTDATPVPTPGMTASIEVVTASATDVLVVPARSIQGSGSTGFVMVRGEEGDEPRPVTTGISNGTLTQILSGLEEGEEVAYTTASTSASSTGQQQGQFTFPGGGGGGGPIIIGP